MASDPLTQFTSWYDSAMENEEVEQADAMCISTIDDKGYPDSRYVLLKAYDISGLIFYTNLNSDKGHQMKRTPKIAANLYWKPISRQIRIKGIVEIVEDTIADNYFSSRPRGSQLGAWASQQSKPLESHEVLVQRIEYYRKKFAGKEIPRPEFWSGYRILPHEFEFWQSGENRLHDRFRYTKNKESWDITRLYP